MNKVNKLRKFFENYNIDGYIVPKNDEFFSEYTPEFKDNLKFISNFSGSYGFALILKKKIIYLLMVVTHCKRKFKVVKFLRLLPSLMSFHQTY